MTAVEYEIRINKGALTVLAGRLVPFQRTTQPESTNRRSMSLAGSYNRPIAATKPRDRYVKAAGRQGLMQCRLVGDKPCS